AGRRGGAGRGLGTAGRALRAARRGARVGGGAGGRGRGAERRAAAARGGGGGGGGARGAPARRPGRRGVGAPGGGRGPRRRRARLGAVLAIGCAGVYPVQTRLARSAPLAVLGSGATLQGPDLELSPGQVVTLLARAGERSRVVAGRDIVGWLPTRSLIELGIR